MATPVTGVESIEIAPIGVDGAMPTTDWTKIIDIADGSVSFTVPPLEKVNVRVEDVTGIRYVLPGDTEPATFAGASIDIDGALAAKLSGGAWNAATSEFSAPANPEVVYMAMRFTSKSFQGKKMQFHIPVAALNFGFAENLTRAGFLQMTFEGSATTPVTAAGVAVSPWGWKVINTQTT